MNEIKISIIIPFYNVENYIGQCLDSIVNQTLSDVEIICVDDGSLDKSSEIATKYCERDNRIRLIKLDKHSGQGVARNVAINEAKGEYIGFVDSDDWIETTMFEKLYNNAKSLQTDISMCGAKVFNNMTSETSFQGYYTLEVLQKLANTCFCAKDVFDNILNINVALWNKIYKRDFLTNIGEKLPEGYIFEDMPFFFAIFLKAQRVSCINENLYYYRINRLDSTMSKTGEKILDRVDMLTLTYQHIENSELFQTIKENVINWIIDDVFVNANLIETEFFPAYFDKMINLFTEIGFENIKANSKNIIFAKAILLLKKMDSKTAQQFIYNFFIADKKLDDVYQEITNNYKFTKELAEQKQNELQNEINSNQTIIDEKINNVYTEITNNYEFTKQQDYLIKEEIYSKLTEQYEEAVDICKKNLYVAKQETEEKFFTQTDKIQQDIKKLITTIEQNSKEELNKTILALKTEIEQEKENLKHEFEHKLNIEHTKYEKKLIELEEKYNEEIKNTSPIIKFINKLGRKHGKR